MSNINGQTRSGDPGWTGVIKRFQWVKSKWDRKLIPSVLLGFLSGCPTFVVISTASDATIASWYDCAQPGECSRHKITASGERFNPHALTAAHKTLPFGTRVRVTHKGRSVVVRINDRGPFIRGRSLDLSRAAARAIGCAGVCRVSIVVVGKRRARR